ncbi:MAG TPA: hypothetical protein VNS88_10485, partial [Nitrospiraceae bacterium]|nr:hypothetical protein [Nitrospiraceae bacterium]
LLRSLMGVKRTWACAPHMSAYDPKRTCRGLWSQQPMIQRGKERPIRERWLKDWDRWTSARPAPGVR